MKCEVEWRMKPIHTAIVRRRICGGDVEFIATCIGDRTRTVFAVCRRCAEAVKELRLLWVIAELPEQCKGREHYSDPAQEMNKFLED